MKIRSVKEIESKLTLEKDQANRLLTMHHNARNGDESYLFLYNNSLERIITLNWVLGIID